MHEGHRQRMLEKLKNAETSLNDHELLEILLYNAIPRKNTNEIAHRLIDAFGSLTGVFQVGFEQLTDVEGVGESTAAYLRIISLFYEKANFEKQEIPPANSVAAFIGYLTGRMRPLAEEVIDLYSVDCKGNVKYTKRYTSKSADKVLLSMREVSSFLSKNEPHALVIAHNHVQGRAFPSPEDDNFTKQVQILCYMSNVKLFDHLIIGPNDYYSYYSNGKLDLIRDRYNPNALFGEKD